MKSLFKKILGLFVDFSEPCDCGNKLSCTDPKLKFLALTDISHLDKCGRIKYDPNLVKNCWRLHKHRKELMESLDRIMVHEENN